MGTSALQSPRLYRPDKAQFNQSSTGSMGNITKTIPTKDKGKFPLSGIVRRYLDKDPAGGVNTPPTIEIFQQALG